MAFIMPLGPNPFGMTQFMNVSRKVGPTIDCSNYPHDVQAVQMLFNIFLPATNLFNRLGCQRPPLPEDGQYDEVLGFWIFIGQRGALPDGRFSRTIVDGIISRANDVGYGAHTLYFIVGLNASARAVDPAGYDNFMRTYPVAPRGLDSLLNP